MSNFRTTDRRIGFLMPPSVDERLPQTGAVEMSGDRQDGSGVMLCIRVVLIRQGLS